MVIETEGSDAPDLTPSNPIAAFDQSASSKPLSEAAQHGTPAPIAPPQDQIGGQVLQSNGQSTPSEAQELPAKAAGADLSPLDPALAVVADGTATDQPSASGQDAAKENHSQQEERASDQDAQMTPADVPIEAATPSVPLEDAQGQPANRSPVEAKVAETIPKPTITPSTAQNGEPTKVANGQAHPLANGPSKTASKAKPDGTQPINFELLDSEDEILIFRPSVKRRRTTTTRPQQESVTNRFVADFIMESPMGKAGLSLQGLIASLKDHFAPGGVPPPERVRLLEILGSGQLQGQALQYKPSEGKGINLSGKITKDGKIACDCSDCKGNLVSLLEFEEHSGAWKRYQTQCVYLPDQDVSLKQLWLALNAEFGHGLPKNGKPVKPPARVRHCRVCNRASKGLMKCGGGCKQYAHAKCVGLADKASGPWSCLSCVEAQVQRQVAKAEEVRQLALQKAKAKAEAAVLKAEARRASMNMKETPKSSKAKGLHAGKAQTAQRASHGSKPPQRVHMAAPTAKAGLTKGRMVRNSNKHKRLFDPDEPNGVKTGQHVVYKTTQGEILLEGEIRVSRDGPCGILCEHCKTVISCSAFEAHAGRGSRRAPYDNIFLNGIALRKLAQALPAEEVVYYPSAEASETAVQEDMMGGCVLCDEKNFQRDGFSNLTVILCDGCEREYHIKCLQEHRNVNLDCLPEGDWFCSPKCQDIHHALRARVALGLVDLNDDYQWQLLHGKDQTTYTTWQLKGCQEILEESFDPIIDQISKQNLVRGMVYSEQQGEWDHTGMFAAILKYKKQNVCALVMRAFGDMLAEVPLIATKTNARRRGHARYLMDALGNFLAEVGVRVLSLPAAHATVETWTKGFGFRPMSADALLETRESLRLLVFPGTEVLYKPLRPEGDPYVAPKKPKQVEAAAQEAANQQSPNAPTDPPVSGPDAASAPVSDAMHDAEAVLSTVQQLVESALVTPGSDATPSDQPGTGPLPGTSIEQVPVAEHTAGAAAKTDTVQTPQIQRIMSDVNSFLAIDQGGVDGAPVGTVAGVLGQTADQENAAPLPDAAQPQPVDAHAAGQPAFPSQPEASPAGDAEMPFLSPSKETAPEEGLQGGSQAPAAPQHIHKAAADTVTSPPELSLANDDSQADAAHKSESLPPKVVCAVE